MIMDLYKVVSLMYQVNAALKPMSIAHFIETLNDPTRTVLSGF